MSGSLLIDADTNEYASPWRYIPKGDEAENWEKIRSRKGYSCTRAGKPQSGSLKQIDPMTFISDEKKLDIIKKYESGQGTRTVAGYFGFTEYRLIKFLTEAGVYRTPTPRGAL